jgi:hypothetical protein
MFRHVGLREFNSNGKEAGCKHHPHYFQRNCVGVTAPRARREDIGRMRAQYNPKRSAKDNLVDVQLNIRRLSSSPLWLKAINAYPFFDNKRHHWKLQPKIILVDSHRAQKTLGWSCLNGISCNAIILRFEIQYPLRQRSLRGRYTPTQARKPVFHLSGW